MGEDMYPQPRVDADARFTMGLQIDFFEGDYARLAEVLFRLLQRHGYPVPITHAIYASPLTSDANGGGA